MKILVIGGGGREHALVWKLKLSSHVKKIWCAPGNAGISQDAECIPADLRDVASLSKLTESLKPDLTVIGPELPLVLGLADSLRSCGFAVAGPGKSGAQLEGSKVFAKQFMERHRIPTAPIYGIYHTAVDAYAALCAVDWPLVIKADGLCAGKGVLVTSSPDEATAFIDQVMDASRFGDAGRRIILEEGLRGEELSYIVLTDGKSFLPLAPARDHKRAFDGDKGPNTGGMGAFSCDGLLSTGLEATIQRDVVQPTISGLAVDGIAYSGFLYFGLMLTSEGPKVLEYNCRLGDPETQAILLRSDFDLADALHATASGDLSNTRLKWEPCASLCVVLASRGYPGESETGRQISGLNPSQAEGQSCAIFHAATRRDGFNYYTSGGRVLAVGATGVDLETARKVVYDRISRISFDGCHFRSDIGLVEGTRGQVAAK